MFDKDTIVISCMDRRLSQYLDRKYNNGHTIFLRNAGANMRTLANSIKQIIKLNKTKKIIIAPHTDCGAMGLVYNSLQKKINVIRVIDECLVSQFKNYANSDRSQLENQINPDLQQRTMKALIGSTDIKIKVDLIDISKLNIPTHDGKHILTITKPSSTKYSDILKKYGKEDIGMFGSYFIQSDKISDVFSDIEIAVTALHINDVRMIPESSEKTSQVTKDGEELKNQPFMSAVHLSII